MKLQNLPRSVLWLRCTYSALGTFLILLAYALALVFAGELRPALALSLGIPALFIIALIWVVCKLGYDRFRYGYDENRITVEKGVFFRRRITIPVCQIQDLHRVQGPIMLLMKLSGIEISTAGSNFTLAYLKLSDADEMIDTLAESLGSFEV